jgi:hypothetical protein
MTKNELKDRPAKDEEALQKTLPHAEQFSPGLDWISRVIRPKVLLALESARQEKLIGKATEADLRITTQNKDHLNTLLLYAQALPEIFNVSRVTIEKGPDSLSIVHATGEKCNRCLRYTDDVDSHPYWPGQKYRICKRCAETLLELHWPPFIQRSEEDFYICQDEQEWHEIQSKKE